MAVVQLGMVNENGRERKRKRRVFKRREEERWEGEVV